MSKKYKIILAVLGAIILIFLSTQAASEFKCDSDVATSTEEEGIVVRSGKEDDLRIAFTCNVDWGEEILPDMLKTFRDNDIRISFFITGRWANNNPKLLRKIYLEGHEIQNHGYGHKLCSQISSSAIREEIEKTEEAIFKYTGVKTSIFAPPSGDFDEKTVQTCKEMDYIISLWSIDTIDWRAGSTAKVIEKRVLEKELKGAIVLMHPKEETAKALPVIIEKIKDKGIEIVTFSELVMQGD